MQIDLLRVLALLSADIAACHFFIFFQ